MKSIPNLVSKHNLKRLNLDENEILSKNFLKYDMIRESCNRLRLENKF